MKTPTGADKNKGFWDRWRDEIILTTVIIGATIAVDVLTDGASCPITSAIRKVKTGFPF